MFQYEDVKLRKFEFKDIPLKIEWVNNSANNEFLHYDLPLEYDKTVAWYEKNKDNPNRFDAVIEYYGEPVGLTGILNIDYKNSKGEDYMIVGNTSYKRKGIATKAGTLNSLYLFENLKLNRMYAFIEVGNPSLGLDLKRGFHVEGYLRQSIKKGDIFVDRYILGMSRRDLIIPGEVHWEDD